MEKDSLEKGQEGHAGGKAKLMKSVMTAVMGFNAVAAEAKLNRRAALSKLQHEDSILRDFHIGEEAGPEYKARRKSQSLQPMDEGGESPVKRKLLGMGGLMAKMRGSSRDLLTVKSSGAEAAKEAATTTLRGKHKKVKEAPRLASHLNVARNHV